MSNNMAQRIGIADIKVGDRHRRDLGDIDALAASIAAVGLLHPLVIRPDGMLIAGERRIEAHKRLGRTDIPVTIVPLDDIVRGEFAENTARKDFTLSEAVAIKRALEPIEKAAAQERMLTGKPLEKFSGGRALDKVAAVVGKHRTTIAKAEAVVAASEADPERFSGLVQYMDASGSVDRANKRLKIERAKQRHGELIEQGCTVDDLVALADSGKRFGVIMADPPWPWETWGGASGKIHSAVDTHYGTSPIADVLKLPVARLAAADCALLIWCTWPHIAIGNHVTVIEAWGFRPCTLGFDWIKQTPSGEGLHTGMGYYTRSNAEPCLLAVKGSPTRLATDVHQVVMAPIGEHSAKPEEVRRRIQKLFPGPYLELYARKPTPGWHTWGNEITRADFAQMAEAGG
jgi:ParB/RepB/Spo0J family partition protein